MICEISGVVVHGKGLGKTVGMPTANIAPNAGTLLPQSGVYASLFCFEGSCYNAMTSIGSRPSVDNSNEKTIESFLLDFNGDLYGRQVKVQLLSYIRPVKKFSCLEEVKKQVFEKDIPSVRKEIYGKDK